MKSIIEITQEILSIEQPLHYRDIANRAMNYYPSLGDNLDKVAAKFTSSLASHVLRHSNKSSAIFKRIPNGKKTPDGKTIYKAGVYGLKKKRTPTIATPPPKPPSPASTTFFGKAGEYGVFSELLFWGYNPAMMVVDHGIDIVAFRNNDYFNIQVKARNPNDKSPNSFSFSIETKVFNNHNNSKTFYIFVIRRLFKGRQVSEYVIMPSSEIERLISSDQIKSNTNIMLKITVEGNSFKINKKHDIAPININDFSIIK